MYLSYYLNKVGISKMKYGNDFSIITFSNTDSPGNTLSNFKTELPSTLELPRRENWCVALQEIGISYKPESPKEYYHRYLSKKYVNPEGSEREPEFGVISISKPLGEPVPQVELANNYELQPPTNPSYRGYLPVYLDSLDSEGIIEGFSKLNTYLDAWGINLSIVTHTHGTSVLIRNIRGSTNSIVLAARPDIAEIFRLSKPEEERNKVKFLVKDHIPEGRYQRAEPYKIIGEVFSILKNVSDGMAITPSFEWAEYVSEGMYEVMYFNRKKPTSLTLKARKDKVRFCKVQASFIEHSIYNNYQEENLRVLELPLVQDFVSAEFENLEYVRVSNELNKELCFKLISDTGELVRMKENFPTYLKLRFKKMPENIFNVRLSSEDSAVFKSNSPNRFKVKLAKCLLLDSEWEVALTSFSSPIQKLLPEEVRSNGLGIFFHDGSNTKPILPEHLAHFNKLQAIGGLSANPVDIVSGLNDTLEELELGGAFVDADNHINLTFKKPYKLVLPYPLNIILGFSEDVTTRKSTFVGYLEEDLISQGLKSAWALEMAQSTVRYPYFSVYSSIIQPSIVGSTLSKLLKVIHYTPNDLKYGRIVKDYTHKTFHQLTQTRIDVIDFEVRGPDGDLVTFPTSYPTIINLEFRRK